MADEGEPWLATRTGAAPESGALLREVPGAEAGAGPARPLQEAVITRWGGGRIT
ncbi:unnamed protein product, partial [Prorocentrum cordatum]